MLRQGLSAPGMYALLRERISKMPDQRLARPQTIPLEDAAMSAVGMFELKFPSMLQFTEACEEQPIVRHNLKSLFQVNKVPSDTTMREILDPVETTHFQDLFKPLFAEAQRGKILEKFPFYNEAYLVSLDGTGFFSSHEIHCKSCCVKDRDGTKTFYHQMLAGVVIHPDQKQVIPLAPEPISLTDGANKNDCERSAAERFLRRFRREHPHLKVIITEDGLSSNAPHIRIMEELEFDYILGCKSGDHKALFDFVEQSEKLGETHRHVVTEGKTQHEFRWMNGVPLNDSNSDILINFIEYWEKTSKGVQHFSWVTDIEINNENLMQIMRGGRARWKIENETFNTLKNLGYNFEHNFGHGHQNLSNNLAVIMMLVFLIDQLQQLSCSLFQRAVGEVKRLSRLWQKMRFYFSMLKLANWEEFLKALAFGIETSFKINTS